MTRQYSVRCVRPAPVSRSLNHYPVTKSDCCLRRRAARNCGGSLSYLGEDTAEQLELMRSAFRVIRTVRENMPVPQCDAIVQAPAPSRPIERVSPDRAAGPRADLEVCRAHPLYRQSEIYGRQGVELSRSLLSGWWMHAAGCCLRWKRRFMAMSVTDGKLHADDTPVQCTRCRVIRRRRPGGCGRMFVMTAMPGQRWHLQCGSLTARTEKASIRQTHLACFQRCAASGCVRRVQRAVLQWSG